MSFSFTCPQCGQAFQSHSTNRVYCSEACHYQSKCKPELVARPCPQCGQAFKPHSREAVYCSRQCHANSKRGKTAHNNTGLTTACLVCGKSFHISPSIADRKYCSRKCQAASQRGKPAYNRQTVQVTCTVCGKMFGLPPSGAKVAKYCSRKCKGIAGSQIKGAAHPSYKDRVTLTCEFCGDSYQVKPSYAKKGSRFCSRQCQGSWTVRNTHGPTSIEIAIATLLDEMGLAYEPQKAMAKFLCDFVLKQYRLVIECDGDYWHNNLLTIWKDKRKDSWLTSHGYRVLRLPEHKIKSDLAWCRKQIRRFTSRAAA